MKNYIAINGKKIELTAEQAEQIRASLREERGKLSDVAVGDTTMIGNNEMIALEHIGGATLLLRKNALGRMSFGKNNNYDGSDVDVVCNKFAEEIAGIVGEDNILLHEVDLTADDGLKDYGVIQRKASLLTADQYRRYVAILDNFKPDEWWWLSTPHSTAKHDNDDWVKCVTPSGCIGSIYYCFSFGVRPFCILKSDIFVSN